MRILLITRDFPPNPQAGTEVYTDTLAAGLRDLGHDILVLSVGKWTEGEHYFNGFTQEICNAIQVTRVHLNWSRAPDPTRYLYENSVIANFVSRFVAESKPDIVHVTSCDRVSASIIPAVKTSGIPLVLSLTDFWFLCPRINLVRANGELCDGQITPWECLDCVMQDNKTYRRFAKFVPSSVLEVLMPELCKHPLVTRRRGLRGMATDMEKRKRFLLDALCQADYVMIATQFGRQLFNTAIPDKAIHYMPYGHDLSWLSDYRGKTPSDVLRFGYVGRLDPNKGPHLLIQAFRGLSEDSRATLSIYGALPNDQYGRFLLELSASDPRIQFCGTYSHKASASVYANLDVLVIPSLWYDFPLVAYEALVTKTALVVTDIPGLNEIVSDQITGLLFERNNVAALSQQLRRFVDSPSLAFHLNKGIPFVKDTQTAVKELQEIYFGLLVPPSPRWMSKDQIIPNSAVVVVDNAE